MTRAFVFIDGANLYQTTMMLGIKIDFQRFRDYLSANYPALARCYYYSAVANNATGHSLRTFLDWLRHFGYSVVSKDVRVHPDGTVKGNMDIELCIDAMNVIGMMNRMVLVSGDGDFCALVKSIQTHGIVVDVISTREMVSDTLATIADSFTDITDIREKIERITR